jgi:hypothetical protein
MRFKTPAPLFNVNGDHGARERRLFVYKSIQDQDPTIMDQSILSRGCCHAQHTHDREKSANPF